MPAAGGVERRLTDHPAPDALPRWSRDGRWIYFTSERSGNWQIYRVRPEGGEPERVRTNAHREWQVEPSPDGRSIAFLSNKEGPEYLYTMDLATGAERVLVRHGEQLDPRQPELEPRVRPADLLVELEDRPPDLPVRPRERRGAPADPVPRRRAASRGSIPTAAT